MTHNEAIVITGLGAIAPNGIGLDAFWENTVNGVSGIRDVTSLVHAKRENKRGGEIPDFKVTDLVEIPDSEAFGRATQLSLAAATMALKDSGLEPAEWQAMRTGVYLGTTMGESQLAESFNRHFPEGQSEASLRYYPSNMMPAMVSISLGLKGPSGLIPTACAAGNYAIGYAFDMLQSGRADCMLAGGADPWSLIAYEGFSAMFAISPDCCRPFDRDRSGILISEGAALLVLESEKRARARGARIYARLAGYGIGADGYHMTGPHPEGRGGIQAGRNALRSARISPDEVDYVSAHGTGTQANDKTETLIVKSLLGDRAKRVPVSSIKSMIGHTMGAASALEAVVSVKALETGVIPPTVNFQNPDPECDLDVVPNVARRIHPEVVMSNSFAFGGNCATVIFQKYGG